MGGSLPTRQNIRSRFLFMYGAYIILIFILWAFVDISILYIIPVVAILCLIGYVNYRTNIKVLTREPLMSSDDFNDYAGVAISDIHKDGLVRIRGETWKAKSENPIDEGREVKVVKLLDKMTLLVQESKDDKRSSTDDLNTS